MKRRSFIQQSSLASAGFFIGKPAWGTDADFPVVRVAGSQRKFTSAAVEHVIADIKNNIGKENCTILMVGYCEPNSLGGHLLKGDKEVFIYGEKFEVKAQVQSIRSMSAHGDYDDLLRFISSQNPEKIKKIFLVHGEYEVQQHFRLKILDRGFNFVEIPYQHQKIEI